MNEDKLRKIISDCFVQLKEEFYSRHTIEEYEDDTNPAILSKRDVIESLDYHELLRIQHDLEHGGEHLTNFVKKELNKRHKEHDLSCSTCETEIDS